MENSRRTFLKAINMVLKPLNEFAEPYVDDFAVHSDDWQMHLKHLEAILMQMRKHNLTLNLKKCIFSKPKVKFIGHIVGSGTIEMNPERIESLLKMKIRETKKQVKQILGLFSYYRQFVNNFAHIAKPLSHLTKKILPDKITWTDIHQKAFDTLNEEIYRNVTLYTFDVTKPFNLCCNSSDYAVAAVLTSKITVVSNGQFFFITQKLTDTQRRWATIEKEAYAIVWALTKLKGVIIESKIHIFTDHNPLAYLTESMSKSAKLVRWSLALQTFDVDVKYTKGKLNVVADCLSRL